VQVTQPNVALLSWNAGALECPQTATINCRLKNFGSESIVVFAPLLIGGQTFSMQPDCPQSFSLAPGQLSTCSQRVTYNPTAEGTHHDTLLIQTDAVNAVSGYVRFPLTGSQTRTPEEPQIAISTDAEDAHLNWQPVTLSIGDCSINVTRYLVFYSPTFDGPYYYHGYTAGTNYTHYGVVIYANGMFYQVYARTGSTVLLDQLPTGGVLTREEVLKRLQQK